MKLKQNHQFIILFLSLLVVLFLANALLLRVSFPIFTHATDSNPAKVLVSAADLRNLFTQNVSSPIIPDLFGVYSLKSYKDDFYFGISAGSPGNYDGVLLAKYINNTTQPILNNGRNIMSEQGFHDMEITNDVIYIPGVDPAYNDGWDLGNLYTYQILHPENGLLKHRNLTNVIHSLGIAVDSPNNKVFIATGSHQGDNTTWVGEIFNGTVSLSDPNQDVFQKFALSKYRVYDIALIKGTLFANIDDYGYRYGSLVYSLNNGQTWQQTTPPVTAPIYPRLLNYKDKILVISQINQGDIWEVDVFGKAVKHHLPDGYFNTDFNTLATDGVTVYGLSSLGIIASINLDDWYLLYPNSSLSSLGYPISLEYWDSQKSLIFTTKGVVAAIYQLKLRDTKPIPIRAIKTVSFSLGFNGNPNTDINTASKLNNYLQNFGFKVNRISRFNPQISSWQSFYSQNPFSINFDLKVKEGYLLVLSSEGVIPSVEDFQKLLNNVSSSDQIYNYVFSPGYHYLSFPENAYNPEFMTKASELCQKINQSSGKISQIYYLDKSEFTAYECNKLGQIDVPIRPLVGYFFNITQPFKLELPSGNISSY